MMAGGGFGREPVAAPVSRSRGGKGGKKTSGAQSPKVREVYKKQQSAMQEQQQRRKDADPDAPCGCGSGQVFKSCCGPFLVAGKQDATPEEMLRARYSAYKLGNADFIIDSTHPKNEDYVKYIEEAQATLKSGTRRWAKEVLALTDAYDYLGLEVVSSEIKGDTAIVIFRALFREGESLMAVEEQTLFLRQGGRWLYRDGETIEPEEAVARQMMAEWPLRPENQALFPAGNTAGTSSTSAGDQPIPKGVVGPKPFSNTNMRKQASGGLGDKAYVTPFAQGRA